MEKQPKYAGKEPEQAPRMLDGPGSQLAYGDDVLRGEADKQYQERKEREASGQHTYSATGMLTPSEIERLRRVKREQIASARKAFANPRPKK
jgi:hypothetical protein